MNSAKGEIRHDAGQYTNEVGIELSSGCDVENSHRDCVSHGAVGDVRNANGVESIGE
jgi:hypothetical protein